MLIETAYETIHIMCGSIEQLNPTALGNVQWMKEEGVIRNIKFIEEWFGEKDRTVIQ